MNAKTEIMSDHSFQTSVGFRTGVRSKVQVEQFREQVNGASGYLVNSGRKPGLATTAQRVRGRFGCLLVFGSLGRGSADAVRRPQ